MYSENEPNLHIYMIIIITGDNTWTGDHTAV